MHPFKRILLLGKDLWRLLPLSSFAALVYVIANSAVMWISASFLSLIFMPDQNPASSSSTSQTSYINGLLKSVTQDMIGGGDHWTKIKTVSILILAIYVIAGAAKFLQERTLSLIEQRLALRLREKIYDHYLKQGLGFFHKRKSGELMTLIVSDTATLNQNMAKVFGIFLRDPFIVIISFVLLAAISWQLLLLTLIVGPLAGFIIQAVGNSLKRRSSRLQKAVEALTVLVSERLNGVLLIKSSGTEKQEATRFGNLNHEVFDKSFKQRQMDILGVPLTEVVGMVIIVSILLVGGYNVTHSGKMGPEDFMRFILIMFSMLAPARSIANGWASLSIVTASGERIFKMIDTDESLPNTKNPKPLSDVTQPIEFKDVKFRYNESLPLVIDGLSLTIQPNETIALVGLSGAGKSTLFSLIMRHYDPDHGDIKLGGHSIKDYTITDYRRQFGVVTQDTILFHDTVAANIGYGCENATHDDIVAAAKLAYADNFIRELDHGYDTIIGDRGVRLSGGQRQRLSLARAFVRNPKYILLDEATSNLDSDSEALIQQALDNMKNLQTMIVIAHRLATIRNADRIALVDNGKIVDVGNYEELITRSEIFARLSKQQFLS